MALLSALMILFVLGLASCAGKVPKPSPSTPAAYLVIPPECMQEMACKSDAIIHDGKVFCKNWELKYSCTKVKK
ncbi:MAG TPA: hypothetical protein VHA06_17955 [Candidatus Angelobacter sp.]|jgi:hypothetical protein|nr:hypothetical protein [Candidatus Angelobacter sp.]